MTVYIKNYYSSIQQLSSLASVAFDEGPIVAINKVGINSSSIGTTDIDPFRQGVEITLEKYAANGSFKISAGTPGHIIKPVCYGANPDVNISSANFYREVDNFNPVSYISLSGSTARGRVYGTEEDFLDRRSAYNGVIEPLSIRALEGFFSNELPFQMHAIRVEFMEGNSDLSTFSNQQVLTVDYVPNKLVAANGSRGYVAGNICYSNSAWFFDGRNVSRVAPGSGSLSASLYMSSPTNGSVKYLLTDIQQTNRSLNAVASFDDSKNYLARMGRSVAQDGADLVAIFNTMTGSTGNYVPPGKKSATTGFMYDNIGYAGTDSIAFGGLTY